MKVPVLHQTDIFHHHADPDDHWDLACQFALSYMGETDLKGILIDYPPRADFYGWDCGDPAIQAISQLNYITGQSVPMGIGVKEKIRCEEDIKEVFAQKPLNGGISLILKTLEEATEPVVIHIVGSCRDMAAAIAERPELFKEKCKAIYLNAGTGFDDSKLEYNVALDAYSYSKVFMAPCPVYWMPCFHATEVWEVGEYGTWYHFQQKEILSQLSEKVQNYFMYMLGRVSDQRWLSYLERPVDQRLLEAHGNLYRNMWCTGGFLHMVGKTVTKDGKIAALNEEGIEPIFEFAPIKVSCGSDGRTHWENTKEPSDKFIFRVLDVEAYEAAMAEALKQLLMKLP